MRRRVRFTIRGLMVAVAVIAILLAFATWDPSGTALFLPSAVPLLVIGLAECVEHNLLSR
jgi:hypothetical protein